MKILVKKYIPIFFIILVLLITLVYLMFGFSKSKEVDAAWYSSGGVWTHRKQITIDHNKVYGGADITNFPMVFSVIDSELKFTGFSGKVASSTGADILFTSSDGTTKLSHEIETYASTTGQLVAWVKIPTLSYTVDTVIYVYYGNVSVATDQQDRTNVWDSNFKGVWHLASTTGTTLIDSTSTGNDGTKVSDTEPNPYTGKLDGAQDFDNSDDSVFITDAGTLDITSDMTLCTWVNGDTFTAASNDNFIKKDGNYILRKNDSGSFGGDKFHFLWWNNTNITYLDATKSSTGYWTHICATVASNVATGLYVNGELQDSSPSTDTASGRDLTSNMYFGYDQDNTVDELDGKLDEIQFSNTNRSAGFIKTSFVNQNSPNTFYAYSGLGIENRSTSGNSIVSRSNGSSWYNSSWTYRKQITINHNKVSTTSSLTNFPVAISLLDTDLKFTDFSGKVASSTGADILFTSSDGTTKLSHEIETYASTTGQLVVWVKIPTLSGTVDTPIYMYFGNASVATDQQDRTNVWDSNFKGVWHLASTTGTTLIDSTTNANDVTKKSATEPNPVSGKLDGSQDFASSTLDVASTTDSSSLSLSGDFTVSFWMKLDSQPQAGANGDQYTWIAKDNGSSQRSYRIFYFNNSTFRQYVVYITGSGGTLESQTTPNLFNVGTWHHVVTTFDVSDNDIRRYIDGVEDTSTEQFYSNQTVGTITDSTARFSIGGVTHSYAGITHSDGSMDEVRVDSSVRYIDWIKTEYNNQNSPETFYYVGPLQSQTRMNSTTNNSTIKVRGGVKFR